LRGRRGTYLQKNKNSPGPPRKLLPLSLLRLLRLPGRGVLQVLQDGADELVGVSQVVAFHHEAVPDVGLLKIHLGVLEDQVDVGVDGGRARIAVINIGDLPGDDDEAAFIQDGEAVVDFPVGAQLIDDRPLGDESQFFAVQFFQGGVDPGQHLLFVFQGRVAVLEEITGGELLGAHRRALGRGRASTGEEQQDGQG
jgi:hypothetical protein